MVRGSSRLLGSRSYTLSTPSLGITDGNVIGAEVVEIVTFNSLSRDHLRGAEGHGRDVQADLSTPSLGITRFRVALPISGMV
jgi:hypothetical protein